MTALHLAAACRNFAFAKFLIQSGADVNAVDQNQDTPLHFAAIRGDLEVIQLLIHSQANLNAVNSYQHTPLYAGFKYHINQVNNIDNIPNYQKWKRRFCTNLIKLLSWYLYQVCTHAISLSAENHALIVQYLKDSYQASTVLQQEDPLLSWMLEKMLGCQSKIQLIEKILEYLEIADTQKHDAFIANIKYLFLLKEDILETFSLNFKKLEDKFSLTTLKKLECLLRDHYAKKLQEKIFKPSNQDIDALIDLDLEQVEKSKKYTNLLKEVRNKLIKYCNDTKIKSPFVEQILALYQASQNYKVVRFIEEGFSEKGLSDIAYMNICRQRMDSTLSLIKDVKKHLEWIMETNGTSLNSSTQFGKKAGDDILLSWDK